MKGNSSADHFFFQLILKSENKMLKLVWEIGFDVICRRIVLSCQTKLLIVGEIEWPEGDEALPIESVDLIKQLLIQDPIERLGTGGAYEVKEHVFFQYVNWHSILKEKAEFIPVLDDEEDTSYFDSKY